MKREDKVYFGLLVCIIPLSIFITLFLRTLKRVEIEDGGIFLLLLSIFSLFWYAILLFYFEFGVDAAYKRLLLLKKMQAKSGEFTVLVEEAIQSQKNLI